MPLLKALVCVTIMLLLTAVVLAADEVSRGTEPKGIGSASDPKTQTAVPDSSVQKKSDANPESAYRQPKAPDQSEAGSSYRPDEPNNAVKSRWQLDMGGSVIFDAGRSY